MRIARMVARHKKMVVAAFLIITVIFAFCITLVRVNYNMTDYLPEDARSTVALAVMAEEFGSAVPNARVMLEDVTVTEALLYKQKMQAVPGITQVLWLDDIIDLKIPLETADQDVLDAYYKDGAALFSVTIAEGYEVSATDAIYALIGENNALAGAAVNTAAAKKMAVSETTGAMLILVPLIIIILLLTTSSWAEPFLYLLSIGVAVLINMGSNFLLGEVSNMTQAISPILQMAVSLDYSIFLLHNFEKFRRETDDPAEAMILAVKRSFPAIIASAATTLFGFAALMFMRFRIGPDLGLNLLKGIALSFLSVMVFLPALTLCCRKLIDRSTHKRLVPELKNAGKALFKLRIPCLILVLVFLVPCFLAQRNDNFTYGFGMLGSSSRSGMDEAKINAAFGRSTAIVLLVPRGDAGKELALCKELDALEHIDSVAAYVTLVGANIPSGFIDNGISNEFYSDAYARIILYTDTAEEGEEAFAVVQNVQALTQRYYDGFYSCGQSVNLYDMKNVVTEDTGKVNFVAILAIALVLLFTFRSLSLPLILLFTIEVAIWINLAVPYFEGNSLNYIGFLVVNTVQLGATVDYAILLTDNYMRERKGLPKKEAMRKSLGDCITSILVSSAILASAGFTLAFTSSNAIVSELGNLLGRGTLLSVAMVVCVLPALLTLFDKVIQKTSLQIHFYKEKD